MELIYTIVILACIFFFIFVDEVRVWSALVIIVCSMVWIVCYTTGPIITENSVITNQIQIGNYKILVDKPVKFTVTSYIYRGGLIFPDEYKYTIKTQWE